VLSLDANPSTVAPSGASTLTADFLHKSDATAVVPADIAVLVGLPIAFGATHGAISAAQATIQATGKATATFTHDATCLAGTASATVDTTPGPTVSVNPIAVTCSDLTALSPANVWIGLKNSDNVGLRVDLRAEVFVKVGASETLVASNDLLNRSTGSSGFNKAILYTIPLTLTGGSAAFPAGAALEIRVSVRRTCSGPGHASGTVRLWYDGQKVDSGPTRDAGSRFDATIGGQTDDYFLRTGLSLSKSAGSLRTSVDQFVNSAVACTSPGGRPFTSFGTWSTP
jgi:hypothetical protein